MFHAKIHIDNLHTSAKFWNLSFFHDSAHSTLVPSKLTFYLIQSCLVYRFLHSWWYFCESDPSRSWKSSWNFHFEAFGRWPGGIDGTAGSQWRSSRSQWNWSPREKFGSGMRLLTNLVNSYCTEIYQDFNSILMTATHCNFGNERLKASCQEQQLVATILYAFARRLRFGGQKWNEMTDYI